jgi:sugar phosphate isomerase/epimerase
MEIGFYTAIMGDRPIEEVANWAAGAGFANLEVDYRRHGGDAAGLRRAIRAVRGAGLEVSMITSFGNLLDADPATRQSVRAAAHTVVEVAAEEGVPMVCTFPGRDETATEDDNYDQIAAYYAPLTERAAAGNVRVLLENWPGPRINYLATTPAGWSRLFSQVPASNLGLNLDPSHLVWQGIGHEQALRDVAGRVFLAHAKDTEIFADRLQQTGYFSRGWWTYRLPGHGRIDWRSWLALLREVGFDGVVSIEHEDPGYGGMNGPLDLRRDGLIEAQRVLRESMPR